MSDEPDSVAIEATKQWVSRVVVGFNFCPFAKREVERDTIRYAVSRSQHHEDCIQMVLDELYLLDRDNAVETTLVILKNGYSSFDDFLDLVDVADSIIDQSGYRGIYQLATFHPDYCFEGADNDAVANYTNRAPYPTLHLIREKSIERVLKVFPNPENIPLNNEKKTEELGLDYFKNLLLSLQKQAPSGDN